MPDRPLPACPQLREELQVLGEALRLQFAFGTPACPCRPPPRDAPAGGPDPHPEALLCAAVLPGAPATCFQLLAGETQVEALLRTGAHLVTPGWLRGWPGHLAELGLDAAAARGLYGEGATRVVLLDTGVWPGAAAALEAFAAHVGLPAEVRPVGLDHLRLRVELAAAGRRAERAERRAADEAALLDAIAQLPAEITEAEVVARFTALLQLLFAPARLAWLPLRGGEAGAPVALGEAPLEPLVAALAALEPAGEPPVRTDGLLFRVGPPGEEVGRLGLEGVQFPQHLDRYRELAPLLAQAWFLSITRARAMEALARSEAGLRRHRDALDELVAERTADLRRTVAEREAALEKARQLSGLIPICFGCKKIRDDAGYWTQLEVYLSQHSDATFSHGLCEDCLRRLYPDAT